LGIAVDVSHCGYRTIMDAMEVSKAPVLFTHANAKALCDTRPMTNSGGAPDQGGVVGVQALPAFFSSKPGPTIDDMLDHVDHYAKLIGVDHIGLGLDLTTGHG
jgi:membrane dipeptidase